MEEVTVVDGGGLFEGEVVSSKEGGGCLEWSKGLVTWYSDYLGGFYWRRCRGLGVRKVRLQLSGGG